MQDLLQLTQKHEEKEEGQQENYLDKKEQGEQEWGEIDLQSGKKVEWYLVHETIETLHFL